MKLLLSIARVIDTCNEWVGRVAQWLIVALVLVFIFESVMRKGFSAPQIWFTEVSYFLFGYYILFGSAYTFLHGGHVSIDLFSERLPEKWRHLLAIACLIGFTLVFSFAMIKGGLPIAINSWQMGELGHSFWRPPIAHFRSVIPAAFLLIFLQGVSFLIKHIAALRGEQS
jgi:TRAP-type mannitol/chloroaromatic compound transport system permease small subunit